MKKFLRIFLIFILIFSVSNSIHANESVDLENDDKVKSQSLSNPANSEENTKAASEENDLSNVTLKDDEYAHCGCGCKHHSMEEYNNCPCCSQKKPIIEKETKEEKQEKIEPKKDAKKEEKPNVTLKDDEYAHCGCGCKHHSMEEYNNCPCCSQKKPIIEKETKEEKQEKIEPKKDVKKEKTSNITHEHNKKEECNFCNSEKCNCQNSEESSDCPCSKNNESVVPKNKKEKISEEKTEEKKETTSTITIKEGEYAHCGCGCKHHTMEEYNECPCCSGKKPIIEKENPNSFNFTILEYVAFGFLGLTILWALREVLSDKKNKNK